MKRKLSVFLSVCMLISALTACSPNDPTNEVDKSNAPTGYQSPEIDDTNSDETPSPIETPNSPHETETTAENGDVTSRFDYLGSYNGIGLFPGKFSAEIFMDEFEWDDIDLEYNNFLCMDSKRNNLAGIYLYNSSDEPTKEELLTAVYGYTFTIRWSTDIDTFPNVTFGGLTWGATKEDVAAVYGPPTYTLIDEDDWTYGYDITDFVNNGLGYALDFNGNETGVTEFSITHYNLS